MAWARPEIQMGGKLARAAVPQREPLEGSSRPAKRTVRKSSALSAAARVIACWAGPPMFSRAMPRAITRLAMACPGGDQPRQPLRRRIDGALHPAGAGALHRRQGHDEVLEVQQRTAARGRDDLTPGVDRWLRAGSGEHDVVPIRIDDATQATERAETRRA